MIGSYRTHDIHLASEAAVLSPVLLLSINLQYILFMRASIYTQRILPATSATEHLTIPFIKTFNFPVL